MSEETTTPEGNDAMLSKTQQMQKFINDGKRVLFSPKDGVFNLRVRKRPDHIDPAKKWVVVVNEERYFCEEIISDLENVKQYVEQNKDNKQGCPPIMFEGAEVVFEKVKATIS